LTQPQCDLFYALARVVPGTNVLAFVAATAHAIRSWTGAVAAVIAYTIPASAIVVALTLAYGQWRDHPVGGPAIAAAMSSIVGIIVAAGWLLVVPRLRPGSRIRTGTFVAAALIVSVWLPPLAVLALGGAAGYFWRERQP
jgi:chromate transporter